VSPLTSMTSKATRPGKFTILSVAVGGVAIAAAMVYWFVLRDPGTASSSTANQVQFQVQRGNITTSISVGGTSSFTDKSELYFGSNGTVADVKVSAGDTVSAGDVIATLDAATVANLRVSEATALSALSDAQAALEKVTSGASSRGAIANAEEALATAELGVASAQKSLDQVTATAGTDSSAVADARTQLSFAERDLATAQAKLDDAQNPASVTNAQQVQTDAQDAYLAVLKRWFGTAPAGYQSMTIDDILDLWGVTLTQIYTTYANTHAESSAPWTDDPSTPWNDVIPWMWTRMSPTVVDTTSATSGTNSKALTPLAEIDAAWNTLDAANNALDSANTAADAALLAAEQGLVKAQTAYNSAQNQLESMLDPILLRQRKAALDGAIAKRDQAVINLAQVNADQGPAQQDAEAKVALAQQTLDDAQAALALATLTSPIDGQVLAINVATGDTVNRNLLVAEIADTSVVSVEGDVDEEDILSVQVGLPVSISLDAVAGRTFTGIVKSVGQASQSQQGAVSFPVVITVDGTDGLNLVEGLTASAEIINSQVTDVLMVPVAAVTGSLFAPTVEVLTDTGTQSVPVQLGNSNGTYIEVKSGVTEGQTVVATIAGQVGLAANSNSGFAGGFRGGEFGGGPVFIGPGGGGQGFNQGGGRRGAGN
jgi:multidrug efflux pump subunit AcrA (membrane-fusion protein)